MIEVIDLTNDTPPPGPTPNTNNTATASTNDTSTILTTAIPPPTHITILPSVLTARHTKLNKADHALLLRKRRWLKDNEVVVPRNVRRAGLAAARATVVFGGEEAGTGVCVGGGWVLTCGHCVVEEEEDSESEGGGEDKVDWEEVRWMVFQGGDVVGGRVVMWDGKRDLALLKITSVSFSSPPPSSSPPSFPSLALSPTPPPPSTRLICIGHPGSSDLESASPNTPTNYDTLVLSSGTYHGIAPGSRADEQDNSVVGALMHSCWTYWGHSGAPLVEVGRGGEGGGLVGLHSSWDDETGMRRGVGWVALGVFLGRAMGFGWAVDGE